MEDDYDLHELEADLREYSKKPREIQEHLYYVVHNRNWKTYLASIEWDTWCKPNDPKTIKEQIKEKEIKNHPFNHFF